MIPRVYGRLFLEAFRTYLGTLLSEGGEAPATADLPRDGAI